MYLLPSLPVRHQGQRETCTAFTEALIAEYHFPSTDQLSPEFIYYHCTTPRGMYGRNVLDISKSVPGDKSLSLAQGSAALLYDIGLLNPRAKSLSNSYEDIVRAVKKVSIGTHCTFPPNNNVGFSKEDLLHVSTLLKQFKALHTALQLCIGLAEDGHMLVDIYSVIVTILYTMHLQLDVHNDIYIKCKYGKETLSLCHPQ